MAVYNRALLRPTIGQLHMCVAMALLWQMACQRVGQGTGALMSVATKLTKNHQGPPQCR